MVTRCSCLSVWSNNNSLISFYHSLSNRPKSFPKPAEDSPSALSAASRQRPFHQPRSVPQASECERLFQSLQLHVCSVCVCVCVCVCVYPCAWVLDETHSQVLFIFFSFFFRNPSSPTTSSQFLSLCVFNLTFHFQPLFIEPKKRTTCRLISGKKTGEKMALFKDVLVISVVNYPRTRAENSEEPATILFLHKQN